MTSKGYWKRRALILEQLTQDKADATVERICRMYGRAQECVIEQIERVFNAYVKGGTLNEKKAMELLSVKQTAEYRAELRAMYTTATDEKTRKDILARLNAPAYAYRISRLQALRDRIYAEARMAGLEEVSYVRDRLRDVLENAYYRQTFDIQQAAGAYYDFNRLTDNQVRAALAIAWSGENWSARLWNNNQRFADAVQDTVTVGIMAGLTYREMRDNLMAAVGLDSTQGAKYRAARLVRTECAYAAGQGILMGYREAGIETYIYLATLDLRTSDICRSLDMRRFPVAEAQAGENYPPMHPNCRSSTMPDMKAETRTKIKRAARDPVSGKAITVPEDMSYAQWYDKYVAGNDRAEANEKAARHMAADRKQFERYQSVLGDGTPKNIAEFQALKYTDDDRWNDLRQRYQDEKLKASIQAGNYDLTINPEKQARHLLDSDGYKPGRSYLIFSENQIEEIQALVSKYAGTGEIQRDKNGNWKHRELVSAEDPVGWDVDRVTGEETATTKFIIHYSRSGIHIVPTLRSFRGE